MTLISKRGLGYILLTGLLAGTLDILSAMLHYYVKTEKDPVAVLNFIASGIFGKVAFNGSTNMVIWGLGLHFMIALIWTVIFFVLYPKIPLLSKGKILSGVLYGLLIWIIMTQLVVPLSNTPSIPFSIEQAIIGIGILILAVGLPVSIMISKYYSGKK